MQKSGAKADDIQSIYVFIVSVIQRFQHNILQHCVWATAYNRLYCTPPQRSKALVVSLFLISMIWHCVAQQKLTSLLWVFFFQVPREVQCPTSKERNISLRILQTRRISSLLLSRLICTTATHFGHIYNSVAASASCNAQTRLKTKGH